MTKWARAFYQPVKPLGPNHHLLTASPAQLALSRRAAAAGAVLLKNEGAFLPLHRGQHIALFGKAQVDYIQGGWGSGAVTGPTPLTPLAAFTEAEAAGDVRVAAELSKFYQALPLVKPDEPTSIYAEEPVPEATVKSAAAFADTAVYVLGRTSGEGSDRQAVPGDYSLSDTEQALLAALREHFAHIVVVLNIGGMMDTSWFVADPHIQAVLLAAQGGSQGGGAIADLLTGKVTPSGKLTDTLADSYAAYPSSATFNQSDDAVDYTEDIYVGYRYFETLPDQQQHVNYPFGFGLSYTTFALTDATVTDSPADYQVSVAVTNTGACAGQEVVQLYLAAPQGKLGKPHRSLVAFAKTRVLQPGETQQVQLTVQLDDCASFDDLGVVAKAAMILEAGDYQFYLGTDVRSATLLPVTHVEPATRIVRQLHDYCAPNQLTQRLTASGAMQALPTGPLPPEYSVGDPGPHHAPFQLPVAEWLDQGATITREEPWHLADVATGAITLSDFIAQLTNGDLVHLLCGQPCVGAADTGGFGALPDYGIPDMMTADGPAGLRIPPDRGLITTAWPSATLLAQTWDPALVSEVGRGAAREVKENNIGVWLAPALNIHRNPLTGRNFEYFAEDPLVAGTMAAAIVQGVQGEGVAACIKHFACNNKETNRNHADSRVSERALREIYLRGFELAVTTAKPLCLMTSYNQVNGRHPSADRELLQGILRGEWGYAGLIMTDWWNLVDHAKEVAAGNNLKMPDGDPQRLLAAAQAGTLTRTDLVANAKPILQVLLQLD